MNEVLNLFNEMDTRIMQLEDDYEHYHLGKKEPVLENERFKVTGCPLEIQDTSNNHFYWLEHECNVKGICDVLNDMSNQIQNLNAFALAVEDTCDDLEYQNHLLRVENEKFINSLKSAIEGERTALGSSVLIALAERLGIDVNDSS